MRNRGNLAILIALGVVAGIAYWLALNPETADTEGSPTLFPNETSSLWDLEADEITVFDVEDVATGKRLTIELIDDEASPQPQWIMRAPVHSLADQVKSANVVSRAADLIVTRTLSDVEDLSQYGVESPSYVIRVTTDDVDNPLVAYVGDVNLGDSAYFVLVEGTQEINLVNKAGIEELTELIALPPYQPTPTPSFPDVEFDSDEG